MEKVVRFLWVGVAGVGLLALLFYAWSLDLLKSVTKIASANTPENSCNALPEAKKENPNKHLFVSCGGFLE